MSEDRGFPIVAGDKSILYNMAKFNAGYNVVLGDIDTEWYIQTIPEEKEEPEPEQKRNKYKRYPVKPLPEDNEWWMHSKSGKYFRETVDDTENSQYFYLAKRQGKFEAFPIHQHHTFRPIATPKCAQTEEERQRLVRCLF